MQRLKLSHNKLTHLGRLPDSVGKLNADDNLLIELPNPPPKNLRFIDISHNQLRRLFDPEKALLQVLKADHNLINTVPAAFSRKECDTRLWLSDTPLRRKRKIDCVHRTEQLAPSIALYRVSFFDILAALEWTGA
ncbi:hypothetical protein SODG_007199 [Sodalis praecaptivus]